MPASGQSLPTIGVLESGPNRRGSSGMPGSADLQAPEAAPMAAQRMTPTRLLPWRSVPTGTHLNGLGQRLGKSLSYRWLRLEHALVARICPMPAAPVAQEALQGVVLAPGGQSGKPPCGRRDGCPWESSNGGDASIVAPSLVPSSRPHGVARQLRPVREVLDKSAPVPWWWTKPAGPGREQRLCLDLQHSQRTILPARGRDKGVVDLVLDSSFSGVFRFPPPITTTRA